MHDAKAEDAQDVVDAVVTAREEEEEEEASGGSDCGKDIARLDEDERKMREALANRKGRSAATKLAKRPAAAPALAPHPKRLPAAHEGAPAVERSPVAEFPEARTSQARPASRPPPIMERQGCPPVFYRAAKISVSVSKLAYRVFLDLTVGNPADIFFLGRGGSARETEKGFRACDCSHPREAESCLRSEEIAIIAKDDFGRRARCKGAGKCMREFG